MARRSRCATSSTTRVAVLLAERQPASVCELAAVGKGEAARRGNTPTLEDGVVRGARACEQRLSLETNKQMCGQFIGIQTMPADLSKEKNRRVSQLY